MASMLTMTEMRTMETDDLKKEIASQSLLVAKIRLSVEMQKEKDTAKLRRERRQLARMQTALAAKTSSKRLSKPKKATTLQAP